MEPITHTKVSVTKENLQFGLKVVRGKDWQYGAQDWGDGIGILDPEETCNGWVKVRWDNGSKFSYRIDSNGGHAAYDLYYYDQIPGEFKSASMRKTNNGLEIPNMYEDWTGLVFYYSGDRYQCLGRRNDRELELQTINKDGSLGSPFGHDTRTTYDYLVGGSYKLEKSPLSGGFYQAPARELSKSGLEIPNEGENWLGMKLKAGTGSEVFIVYEETDSNISIGWTENGSRRTTSYRKRDVRDYVKGSSYNWDILETPVSSGHKTGRVISAPKVMPVIVKGAIPTGRILKGKEKRSTIGSSRMYAQIITD